ncbi:hypothetical protein [Burkholderia latens]|uniref:hypothetical protein n=1 Tax=Burkholderia latens TaxID=488446 RepID=UPI001AE8DB18|nr:hypothetical protein [Burkholderia latens]MBR7963041.1 hypothetical protein [Burkholderia vietnamiensis]QTO45697.1 hypothetical protein J8I85_25095 [Burkholderia latens]
MRRIGFSGGSSICELGPVPDVALFFECLKVYAEQKHPEQNWSLLTDRLYRRYLRLEELDQASALMEKAKQLFAQLPAQSSVEWDSVMLKNPEKSWLNPEQPTLADVFEKYFANFAYCVESARLNYESFKAYPGYSYEPVRVVISDLTGYARDKNKPLAEYDALEGTPFWLE